MSDSTDPAAVNEAETALRHMFGRDFAYVFGGVLPLALSALILPVLTRLMGPKQFGIASFAVAIYAVLLVVLSLGLQTGIQREFAKVDGRARARDLLALTTIVVVCLTAGLVLSARGWAAALGASHFLWVMKLVAMWSGGAAIALVCLGYLRSSDRLKAYLVVVLMQSIGAQGIGVAVILVSHHTASDYLLGVVVGQTVAAVLAVVFVMPTARGIVKFGLFGRVLLFSAPLITQQLAAFVLWSGDRIVVQRDLGSVPQARYAVAYAVGAITINIVSQLNQAWMPRVFQIQDLSARRDLLVQVQNRLLGLLSPAVLGLAFAVPLLLVVASPASYHPKSLLFVTLLIVPTSLPYAFALANTRTLLAHGLSSSLALVTLFCAAMNVVLNVLLVPHFGISGSAFATLLSYALLSWSSALIIRGADDRLPHRLRAEIRLWLLVGVCLCTDLLPSSALGDVLRGIGVLAALAWGMASILRIVSGKRTIAPPAWLPKGDLLTRPFATRPGEARLPATGVLSEEAGSPEAR